MNNLELYREELANCDAKITEALKERYAIIEKIMAYKEEYGMPILQPEQEEKQKKRLMFSLHNDKHRDEIYDVFERIQRNSKKIQARKLFDYNIVLIGFMGAGKSTISDRDAGEEECDHFLWWWCGNARTQCRRDEEKWSCSTPYCTSTDHS